MSRISDWYVRLGRGGKTAVIAGGAALALAVAALILIMALTPDKVEVRYGTIVWDPLDGHVWEDNTQTVWVDASQASDYRVERIVRYSPEHEAMIAEQQRQLAEEQARQEDAPGYTSLQAVMPASTIDDLNALQADLDSMSQNVVSGMEMANRLAETRSTLQAHYNDISAYVVIPEIEQYKQRYLSAIAKYVHACDMVLKGMETADQGYIVQAQASFDEATAIVQDLGAMLQSLVPPQ